MNINVNYNPDFLKIDLAKLANARIKALYHRRLKIWIIVFFSATILIITGIVLGYSLLGNALTGIGLDIPLVLLLVFREKKLSRQKQPKKKEEVSVDPVTKRTLSFTDELFIYRDEGIYYEYKWDYFSYYLLTQEFIFIFDKTSDISFFVGKEHLSEKEIEELSEFLSSRFSLSKSKTFY